ncbi:MAG: response regulator [Mariprofundaceae bacterium]|nr:response regulator [Mariprofundaceae bacterium]
MIRELAFEVFTTLNYKCYIASNSLEAIRLFKAHASEINLVLLDIVMPEVGGIEAARKIQSIKNDIPIAFMSGYESGMFSSKHKAPENMEVIEKHFSIDVMSAVIRSLLDLADKGAS